MTFNVNLNVSGKLTIVLESPGGTSPPLTPADLDALGELIMSVLSDKLAAVNASLDAAVARVQSDVAGLTQQIATLQALVDGGAATPDELQALDDLKAKLDAIDPSSPQTLPAP